MTTLALFKIGAWLAAVLDGAVGTAVLWMSRTGRENPGRSATIGLPQLLLGMLASCACFCITCAALRVAGLNVFGLMRVAYLAGAVVPPVMGLALLALAFRRNPTRVPLHARILALLLLTPIPVCAYASFIAPYQLQIERVDAPLDSLPSDAEPIRVVVLADLQTNRVSDYEREIVNRALAEQPDLIVLPGDFCQGSYRQFQEQLPRLRELLNRLEAPGGVFAVRGNIDPPSQLRSLLEGTPVRFLEDEIATTEVCGLKLAIAGIDWNYGSSAARRTIRQLRQVEADARILLSHSPDCALITEAADRIDLIVAGHTHGGQVVVPGLGPLVTASRLPRRVAAGGQHRVGHQLLYISRGVGFERGWAPPVRFCCPPELTVLTLRGGR